MSSANLLHPKQDYSATVPVEIWHILSEPSYHYRYYNRYSLSTSDYASLSVTCTLFRAIFQKAVFASVRHNVSFHLRQPNQVHEEQRADLLRYTFSERMFRLSRPPSSALNLVQEYTLRGLNGPRFLPRWPTEEERTHYEVMLTRLGRALGGFTALKEVHLYSVNICEEMLTGLGGLASLQCVSSVRTLLSRLFLPTYSLIVTEELSFDAGDYEMSLASLPLFRMFSNKKLRRLTIINSYSANLSLFLTPFTEQGPSVHLQEFDFPFTGSWDLPALVPFLLGCPSLEDLLLNVPDNANSVEHMEASMTPAVLDMFGHTFSSTALPRLRKYKGPTALVTFLVPRRPVSVVELCSTAWTEDDWEELGVPTLDAISRSTASIETLSLPVLPARSEVLYQIFGRFPALRRLKLTLDDDNIVSIDDENAAIGADVTVQTNDLGNPLSSPDSFKGIMERLALDIIKLPPLIESLSINDSAGPEFLDDYDSDAELIGEREYPARTCMTRPALRHVVSELAKRYPSLKHISLGYPELRWTLDEDGQFVLHPQGVWVLFEPESEDKTEDEVSGDENEHDGELEDCNMYLNLQLCPSSLMSM